MHIDRENCLLAVRLILAFCAALFAAACAGPRAVYEGDASNGPDAGNGSVAISLRGWSPFNADRLKAAEAFFVRVDDDGDPYSATSLIASNHEGDDGRVYLLNVPAGRYAAVAFRTRGGNPFLIADKQWIFFEKPLIGQTVVEVTPGGFAFAGEYTVGGTPWRKNAESMDEDALYAADTAQVHYLDLMFPDAEEKSTLARIYGSNPVYLGNHLPSRSAGRAAEAEEKFWGKVRRAGDLDAAWWPRDESGVADAD
jgi:hypothetical protein